MATNDPRNKVEFPRYKKPGDDKKNPKENMLSGNLNNRLKQMAKNIKAMNGKSDEKKRSKGKSKVSDKKKEDDKKDDDKKDDDKK